MNVTFGGRLSSLRRSRGLSQEELAEAAGVSRQAVSKWELDEARPEVDKVVLLAQTLGVTTDYLLMGTVPPEREAERAETADGFSQTVRHGAGVLGRMLRKHGYKAGYLLIVYGLILLVAGGALGLAFHSVFSAPKVPQLGGYDVVIGGDIPMSEREVYNALGIPSASAHTSGFKAVFYVVAGIFAVSGTALIVTGAVVAVKYKPKEKP